MRLSEFQRLVTKPPRVIQSTVERSSRTQSFIVQNGLLYDYYSIKVSPTPIKEGKPFHKIEKLPSILADGLVVINKKIYIVSRKDLLRRRINVNNEYHQSTQSQQQPVQEPTVESTVKQSTVNRALGVEVSEDVNMAWDEQIRTLLHVNDPEAWYWETEDTPQPLGIDESGTIQDTE